MFKCYLNSGLKTPYIIGLRAELKYSTHAVAISNFLLISYSLPNQNALPAFQKCTKGSAEWFINHLAELFYFAELFILEQIIIIILPAVGDGSACLKWFNFHCLA